MQYLAILGRQPEFGLLELESCFGKEAVEPIGRQAALLAALPDINRLGGVQKLGRVVYRGPAKDINEAPIDLATLPIRDGKTTFGLSYYGINATQAFVVKNGITLKKRLKSTGSVRFVAPTSGTSLSAAQVKFNSLIRNGFELLIVISKQEMTVAVTEAIQDIDSYAARDYQRPSRSARVGMLPPKLAQIMVNTTSAPLVYDPFCGTGVVLQEALLLGRSVAGSDLEPDMTASTHENIDWLRKKLPNLPAPLEITATDARNVTFPDEPLAIVSEGYLGTPQLRKPDQHQAARLASEADELFGDALRHWRGQLPPDTEVTITIPHWQTTQKPVPTPIIDRLTDLGYTLRSFAHVDAQRLIYRRPDQIVGRQLLVMRTI